MVNAIEFPKIKSMMHFEQGQIEVLKLSIPNNSDVIGRSVAEISQGAEFPTDSLIIGYQPHGNEDLIIPKGNTVIEAYSTILIVTKHKYLHQVIDFIEGCK
jgi:trk system potassium uptake protein